MKEIKAGVIGMGKMGLLHSGILNSLNAVKVSAVAENEKLVIGFLRNIPDLQVYNNYKKMLKNADLDIVYITTPVVSHIPIALSCAENNLPFFVEKPIGVNVKECASLCSVINKIKVPTMVGYYLRYAETFAKVKELLESNVIGKIKNISSSVYQSQSLTKTSGWRFKKEVSGGGVLIDLGTHLIDLLLWYFGEIEKIQATIQSNFSQVEDTASAIIQFESGLKCSFETSWNVKNYRLQETTIKIEGNSGKMIVNENFIKLQNNSDDEKHGKIWYRQSLYKGVTVDIGGPEYTREDEDFIECVRENRQPVLNVIDSSKIQSVVDSIYKSSKNKSLESVRYIE